AASRSHPATAPPATTANAHADPLSTPPRIQTGMNQAYGPLGVSATRPAAGACYKLVSCRDHVELRNLWPQPRRAALGRRRHRSDGVGSAGVEGLVPAPPCARARQAAGARFGRG